MHPIVYAIIAASAFGLWTVFHKIASPHIDRLLGAILVSLAAVVLGGILILFRTKNAPLVTNPKGVIFLVLAGVAALAIDYFALQAYSRGLPVSLGGPIIIGGSILMATVAGLFMGDALSALKVLGILLIIAGAAILGNV